MFSLYILSTCVTGHQKDSIHLLLVQCLSPSRPVWRLNRHRSKLNNSLCFSAALSSWTGRSTPPGASWAARVQRWATWRPLTPPPTHGRCHSRCPARSSGTAAWSSRSTSRAAESDSLAPPAGWRRGRERGGAPGAAQGWDGQEAELWTRTPAFTTVFFSDPSPENKQKTDKRTQKKNQKIKKSKTWTTFWSRVQNVLMLTTGQPCQSAMPKPSSVTQQAQREPLLSLFLFLFGRKAHRLTFCDVHVSGKETSSPPATGRLSLFFFFILSAIHSVLLFAQRRVLSSFSSVQVIFSSGLYRTGGKLQETLKVSALSLTCVLLFKSNFIFLCNKNLGKKITK